MQTGFDSFVHALATLAGRTVALAALSDGNRRPVGWVADAFFLGIVDELEAQGVPRRVVADMLGMSRRTLQRQVAATREGIDLRRRSVWSRIWTCVDATSPTPEELELRIKGVERRTVAGVLSDMLDSGWVTLDRGRLRARPAEKLTGEQVRTLVIDMQRNGWPVDAEAIARELGVDRALVDEALTAERSFGWTVSAHTRWVALDRVLVQVGRFLRARLGDEPLESSGGAWTITLTDKPDGAERALRSAVAEARENIERTASEHADPSQLWDRSERKWTALLLETVGATPRP